MNGAPLPLWYDSVCIVTSAVYACAAYLLLNATHDLVWNVVIASGLVSMLFRTFRLRSMLRSKCDIRWNFLCSSWGVVLFCTDFMFAVASILALTRSVDPSFLVPLIGITCSSWYMQKQGRICMSCVTHILAHVGVCVVLLAGLSKVSV